MTLSDLKKSTIIEYEYMLSKLSNGNIISDLMPIVRRCQIISFMTEESVSPNYQKSIIKYFENNEHIKKR